IFGGGANSVPPTTLTQTDLKMYRCPSDIAPDINSFRNNHGTSNYRAVRGTYGNPPQPSPLPPFAFYTNEDMGGVLFQNSKIRMTDGSVRFFQEQSKPTMQILRFLAKRNDGSVVNPDF